MTSDPLRSAGHSDDAGYSGEGQDDQQTPNEDVGGDTGATAGRSTPRPRRHRGYGAEIVIREDEPAIRRLPYSGFENQYIAGRWRPGRAGSTYRDIDPYTGQVLVETAEANAADLDEAYEAAAEAQTEWAATLPQVRATVLRTAAELMEARRDEITEWIVHETGGTRGKAEVEWGLVRDGMLDATSYPYRVEGQILPIDEPSTESFVFRQPLGVIGVISPWNFPMQLSNRSVAPALAVGDAVVLKPSEETLVTGGLLLARIYEEAGLPAGVLNVVVGRSRDIGDYFVQHEVPRLISFTGSTEVGRHIGQLAMTAPLMKRVALELGGNGPFVVLDDADLDQAAHAGVVGRFLHQGEICMSTNRIIVDAKLYDDFVESFAGRVRRLKYGDPSDPDTIIGPVINEIQLRGLLEHIEGARKAGARQLVGGEPEGLVLPPHVFADVSNDMAIAQDELFGPVVPIIKAADEDDAVRIANATSYGLSSAVFSGDEARAFRVARRIQAGMTHINTTSVQDKPNNPFGGEKNSGIGRFNGEWVIRELTTEHWITVAHAPVDYPF